MERFGNVLVKNERVYAPEDLGIKDVLIMGGKIIKIGDGLRCPLEEVSVVDACGYTMIPGIFDGHVHVTGGGGENGFSSRVPELSAQTLYSCGVTSVLGTLGTDSLTRSVKNLLAKVKALKEEGMSAWCLTGAYNIDSPTVTGSVADDICFIDEIIGVKVAFNDHRSSQPTVNELIRLASNVRLAALTSKKAGVVHMHQGRGKDGMKLIFDALDQSDLPVTHFRPTHCGSHIKGARKFAGRGGYVDLTAGLNADKTAERIVEFLKYIPLEQLTMSSDGGGSMPVWNEKKEMVGMKVGTPATLLAAVLKVSEGGELDFASALSLIKPSDNVAPSFTNASISAFVINLTSIPSGNISLYAFIAVFTGPSYA